jgi:hypothetical protein
MDAFQAATQRSAPPPALLFLFGTPDERAQPAPPTTPRAASGNAEYDPLYCCVPFLCSAHGKPKPRHRSRGWSCVGWRLAPDAAGTDLRTDRLRFLTGEVNMSLPVAIYGE